MKMNNVILCVVMFASFAISFDTVAAKKAKSKKISNSEKAKKILDKAAKTLTEMKGFSAKIENGINGGAKKPLTIYQQNNPDETIFMRMEMGQLGNPMIFVSNDKGYWYIMGNTAIKMAYMTKMQADAMSKFGQIPEIKEDTKYSVENGKINNIDCFVVTSKLSEEQMKATLEIAMQSIPEDMRKRMKEMNQSIDMSTKIPSITKSYIGKKDYFTYSTEQYNKNGKKITQMTYSDVKLNIKLDAKLFQIPENMEQKEAKTIEDFTNIMIKSMQQSIKK